MDRRHLFVDERTITNGCTYCGCALSDSGHDAGTRPQSRTRDHVPSKVFLDEPHPSNLPVVDCCYACNNRLSIDEQYVAALIECVVCGSVETPSLERQKISTMLQTNPSLKSRLFEAKATFNESLHWRPESARIIRVITKLGQGHAFHEQQLLLGRPDYVNFISLIQMSPSERSEFECGSHEILLPEVGSLAFKQVSYNPRSSSWIDIQTNRYRYAATGLSNGFQVRIVIREYLACDLRWNA